MGSFSFQDFASEFEWSKSRGSISLTNAKIDTNILHFQPFEFNDIDVYTCTVQSPHGTFERSIAFDYEYNFYKIYDENDRRLQAPRIIEIYEHGLQALNEPFEFECISDTKDTNISWYFNSSRLKLSDNFSNNGLLKFESLQAKDQGIYECIISNRFGYDRKSTFIRLEAEPNPIGVTKSIQVVGTSSYYHEYSQSPTTYYASPSKHTIQIQILSDPLKDHVENGTVKLKCLSSMSGFFELMDGEMTL